MPASFREPTFVEAWLAFPDESGEYFARDARFWTGFARLAPGSNLATAQTEVRSISRLPEFGVRMALGATPCDSLES